MAKIKIDSLLKKVSDYGISTVDDKNICSDCVPLQIISLYQFGLSVSRLTFDPRGNSRVVPGTISSVPGDPFRLAEVQQFIAFSQWKLNDIQNADCFEIIPTEISTFGLIISPLVVVQGEKSLYSSTSIKVSDGSIGFSFSTTRRFEISTGFVVAYLHLTKSQKFKREKVEEDYDTSDGDSSMEVEK